MNKKILIVEDQPIVALHYSMFFNSEGYDCISFSSGKKTLDYLENEKPDLALLDIRLEDKVSGIEVGEFLKQLNVPLIFISAFSDQENYDKALMLQPVRIFIKPVDVDELNIVVGRILSHERG
jgi:DNA-binding response OmpR family regulator